MYFIYLAVHAFGSVLCTHTLLVQTHTHMTFPPPLELRLYAIVLCFYVKRQKHTFFTICILTFKEIYLCVVGISFAREKCKNFRFFAKKFGTKKIQKFVWKLSFKIFTKIFFRNAKLCETFAHIFFSKFRFFS